MRTRILIYDTNAGSFMTKFMAKFTAAIDAATTTVKVYDEATCEHGLNYKTKTNHYAMYQEMLRYAIRHRYDVVYIPRLTQPELLLAELDCLNRLNGLNGQLPFKLVCGIFGYQDIVGSDARTLTYHKLGTYDVHLVNYQVLHDQWRYATTFNIPNVTHVSDPIYETPELYQVKRDVGCSYFNVDPTKFNVLYFGNMFYGKGHDILLRAMAKLPDIHCIMAGDATTCNYQAAGIPKALSNVTQFKQFIDDADLGKLFACADIVVLPYRDTYSYGTSGVLVQAMLAGKPVVVPDIYPFNVVIERYGVGLTFSTEFDDNATATHLAMAIKSLATLDNCMQEFKAATKRYVADITPWAKIVEVVLHG